MFKRRVNELEITLQIQPVTPVLIKAGDTGADPTQPDMEFVRTYHAGGETIYLPGSSLKGAIRAHAERLARTVGGSTPRDTVWSCDPLSDRDPCRGRARQDETPDVAYANSCFICRIFGSTVVSSHFSIGDAYPDPGARLVLEERNGVAIDRIYGSVAVGPFNYQVATEASFSTTLRLFNFSLDQLGLVALVLRDFDRQRVSIGFGKSRGLGQIRMTMSRVNLRYPGCILDGGIRTVGGGFSFSGSEAAGAGALFAEADAYGYPREDRVEVAATSALDDFGLGVEQTFDAESSMLLWRGCVSRWRERLGVPA